MSNKNPYIYTFTTELEGYINLDEPGGKYNTCTFCFGLTDEVQFKAEEDRDVLLEVARSKVNNPNRLAVNPPKWNDEGRVKYSFGGDTSRIAPVIIDEYGEPVPLHVLKGVREGTVVKLLMEQKPYWKPSIGTTVVIHGIQILELVSVGSLATRTYELEQVKKMMGVPNFKHKQEALV